MSTTRRQTKAIYHDLLPRWRSLGIMFSGDYDKYADPEKTLLDSLPVILSDAKMLYLITNWINQHADVIHCERLLSLLKVRKLPYDELMVVGALTESAREAGHKLDSVSRYIKPKIEKERKVQTSEHIELPVQLGQCPPEPTFKKFGIIVPTIVDLSVKILDTKTIIKTNHWIRNRIFFGCNWRADIYTTLNHKKNKIISTYWIAKNLGCSNETALRIRKNFELVEGK